MIEEFVSGISAEMGINLSKVSLVDGAPLGCIGVHLLNMSAKGHTVGVLVSEADLVNLKNGGGCENLEVRMRTSLSRLQNLINPR